MKPGSVLEWSGASSPRLVSSTAFYGDEPSPLLLAYFFERALTRLHQEASAQAWTLTLVLERAFPTRDSLKPVDRGLQQHYHLRYALAGIQFGFCTANIQTSRKFFRINDS